MTTSSRAKTKEERQQELIKSWEASPYTSEQVAQAVHVGMSFPDFEERWPRRVRKNVRGRIPQGYIVNQYDPYELYPCLDTVLRIEDAFNAIEGGDSIRSLTQPLQELIQEEVDKNYTLTSVTLATLYRNHRKPFSRVDLNKKMSKAQKTVRDEINGSSKLARINREKRKAKNDLKKAQEQFKTLEKDYEKEKLKKELKKNPRTQKLDLTIFNNDGSIKTEAQAEVDKNVEILFKPNPGPQEDFLAADEQEVLYGGAAGGGKSYALLGDPMRYFGNKNFRGLLVRRTNDELRELKTVSLGLYPSIFPGAKFKERDSQWVFPSGASLWMTYLEQDKDVSRYQGQSFSWIGFDELTQYPTPYAWNYLRSRLRTTDTSLKTYMRATANPGGPGHSWVKKMFVDPAPSNQSFWATDSETGEIITYPNNHKNESLRGMPLFKRKFIPASLYDNPYLTRDGSYEANLMSLPQNERRRLLEGDWSVVDGAAFSEFNPSIHVMDPFPIPSSWFRFRSCDYGYSSHSAVLWFAVDPAFETLYCYRELYVSKKDGDALGKMIRDIEAENEDRVSMGVLDSSAWHSRGYRGPTIAEALNRYGLRFRPSDRSQGSRINGKNQIHKMLKYDPDIDRPGLVIFSNCRQLIIDLPSLPVDPKGTDDIDQRYGSDHTYDALRYAVSYRYPKLDPFLQQQYVIRDSYSPVDETFGY